MRVPLAQGQLRGILRLRFKFGGLSFLPFKFICANLALSRIKGVGHYLAVDYDYQ